ncbi:FAD/NAD(P)-binding protein [Phaeobacter sp. A36a-5a]|uniref:FAD/NAD(P)-binding protein n=1 Tax=Phaeobacter bryozoorum TaxID=1086632 RepID=UPI0030CA0E3D
MKIAVLGAGYAGVSVLENLVATLPDLSALSVDVFDKSRSFGPGVAYQEDAETNLLNRPLKLMYLARRNDFRDWLRQTGATEAAADEDGFLQRALFGRFLQSQFDALSGRVRTAGGRIRMIGAEVETIAPSPRADALYRLGWMGSVSDYDAVYLCLGTNLEADPYGLGGTPGYFRAPYPAARLKALTRLRVGILGCRLTAYDVALGVNGRRMLMTSRRAGLPKAVTAYRPVTLHHLTPAGLAALRNGPDGGRISLSAVMELFEAEMQHQGVDVSFADLLRGVDSADNDLVSSILAETNMLIPQLWASLSDRAKAAFLRHFHRLWSNMRVPISRTNADRIAMLQASGALSHRSGLRNVSFRNGRYRMEFADGIAEVDAVINATGLQRGLDESNPLIRSLLAQGFAERDATGGIKVQLEDCRVLTRDGRPSPGLFALGQLTCGTFYMVNNIDVIHHQARIATASALAPADILRSVG